MTQGRKKAKRSKLAGERLCLAKEICGKTYEGLLDDERWDEIVKIIDEKTIRSWVYKGLPENRIASVAAYFGVRGDAFTDAKLATAAFKKLVYARLYESTRPPLPGQAGEIDRHQFNWAGLSASMRLLEEQPIYADQGYSLKDIFLFQDACFKHNGGNSWEEIGSLKTYLDNFDFAEARRNRKPVILYGDFGIGKTSFLKMFASHLVATDHEYLPIFIPLRELAIHGSENLIQAIIGYLDEYGRFSLNRLDRPILLLLDGFDELNFYLNDNNWISKAFDQLTSLYRYTNVHIIISSRPILFLKEEENIPEGSPIFQILEFGEARIREWIDRWKAIEENADSKISFENLKERNLAAITRNPLLLYMTSKIYDSELTERIAYSRGIIYKRFYDWTIKGKFKKDVKAHNLPDNYRQLLQNIAMTMRSLGTDDGFIDYDTLRKHISIYQKEVPEEHEFRVNELVLVAHFFKIKDRDTIKYIEFAHKSFREYLVAEKIFDLFCESIAAENIDSAKWLAIGRMLPKTEELAFLKDLLYTLPDADLVWLHGLMTHRLLYLLISTGQLKKALNQVRFPSKSEIGTIYYRSINLSCLAYIVGNIIYSRLADRWERLVEDHPLHKGRLPPKFYSTQYIYHVCHTTAGLTKKESRYNQNWIIAKAFMNGIDLSGLELEGIDFSHGELNRTTFAGSTLTRCSFVSADLEFTDCSGTTCQGTDFSKSICADTNFSQARMQQITFRDAKLHHADFTGATLVNVDLSGTHIERCRFDGCTFRNVIFDTALISDCTGSPTTV